MLAGDIFELWAEPNNTPAKALRSHPRFAEAVQRFVTAPDRQVVVLAGNHDGPLGWAGQLVAEVRLALRATVATAVDLDIATGAGRWMIRVEHGHQLDPDNVFTDPTQPGDRPLGHHVVGQLLPALRRSAEGGVGWLGDVSALNDANLFARYVASRLFYRRLVRHLWWVAIPSATLALLWLAAWLIVPLRPYVFHIPAVSGGWGLVPLLGAVARGQQRPRTARHGRSGEAYRFRPHLAAHLRGRDGDERRRQRCRPATGGAAPDRRV